jgi:hypothetical protein
MKQYEAVIEALERLGGVATFGQLNQEVFKIKDCMWGTKTPFASIRRIVQDRNEIYRIKPGLWALEKYRKRLETDGFVVETAQNTDSETVEIFNHTYYQGILLEYGKLMELQTYSPNQDKNKKYTNSTLGQMRTLQNLPKFSYEDMVQRSSTIDVIWFHSSYNSLLMPDSFFEVEHSTDIQNSLLKFVDLKDFNVKMVIVADKKREDEFNKKMEYMGFETLRKEKKVRFLSYDSLIDNYHSQVKNTWKI